MKLQHPQNMAIPSAHRCRHHIFRLHNPKCLYLILLYFAPILDANVPSGIYDLPVDSQLGGEQKCQPLHTPFCNIDSYQTVQPFNNTLGHTDLNTAIAELHKFAYLLQREPCKSKIQLFLCSLYAPVCVKSTILDRLLLPCRDDCEEARQVCSPDLDMIKSTWPDEWDCRKFNYTKVDKLCVIDNAKENRQTSVGRFHSQPPTLSPVLTEGEDLTPIDQKRPYHGNEEQPDHENICADDLFDCRLRDPLRNMNALCIDPSWVCDGKKDCVINGTNDGLDEEGCEKKCTEGQHFCDGRCINKSDICNGKVDCSLGTDELDCYGYVAGLIQSILCIFALFLAIYLLVRFFRIDDEKAEDTENQLAKQHYASARKNFNPIPPCIQIDNSATISQALEDEIVRANQHFNHETNIQRCPIYHEPAYSILTRSDYERLNVGGYSGASSVYASYGAYHSHIIDDSREPPAAPPPTPAPQQIYSSGSISKLADLYVNMNDPHKMDLLD